MVIVGLQHQSVRFKHETDRARRNGKTAMVERYASQRVVLTAGTAQTATGMSLMVLTHRVHSDGAISPGWNYFLLILEPPYDGVEVQ
jgi:hypothetical protein